MFYCSTASKWVSNLKFLKFISEIQIYSTWMPRRHRLCFLYSQLQIIIGKTKSVLNSCWIIFKSDFTRISNPEPVLLWPFLTTSWIYCDFVSHCKPEIPTSFQPKSYTRVPLELSDSNRLIKSEGFDFWFSRFLAWRVSVCKLPIYELL